MDEIAAFLRAHPPFDALPDDELERLAAGAEVHGFAAGETIFAQGAGPQTSAWVVHTGASSSSTTGASSTSSGRASCSATPRCSPSCRPASRGWTRPKPPNMC